MKELEARKSHQIDGFPRDNKERVVWWYAACYLGHISSPTVEVVLRDIDEDGSLSPRSSVHRVAIVQLDIVRLGSIWKGQKSTGKCWKDYRTVEFKFNLNGSQIECITAGSKVPESDYFYIPRKWYPFSFVPKEKRRFDIHCYNSQLTKLVAINNVEVLVPCLELLTSIYTPEEQDIRRYLLTLDIDSVLERYVRVQDCYEDNHEYHVSFKDPKSNSNSVFLAYLALNPTTRQRVSRIWAELQQQYRENEYGQRYPIVLPYHPKELNFVADGIWLPGNRFLVLRINQYSLPAEKRIVKKFLLEDSSGPRGTNEDENKNVQTKIIDDDLPITSETDPGINAGTTYFNTQVRVYGDLPSITREVKLRPIKNKGGSTVMSENTAVQLSSGEKNSTIDSMQTAKLKAFEFKSQNDKTAQAEQMSVINEVDAAIHELIALESSTLRSVVYIDEHANEHNNFLMARFPKALLQDKWIGTWPYYQRRTLRRFLLLKLVLNDGRIAYMLEIEARPKESGFRGLLFNVDDVCLSKNKIYELLKEVARKRGIFRPRIKKGLTVDATLPVAYSLSYEHSKIQNSMVLKIEKVIRKAIQKDFFR